MNYKHILFYGFLFKKQEISKGLKSLKDWKESILYDPNAPKEEVVIPESVEGLGSLLK